MAIFMGGKERERGFFDENKRMPSINTDVLFMVRLFAKNDHLVQKRHVLKDQRNFHVLFMMDACKD